MSPAGLLHSRCTASGHMCSDQGSLFVELGGIEPPSVKQALQAIRLFPAFGSSAAGLQG
jgi:hypothetical protein